jgi:L-arabinose isomerase
MEGIGEWVEAASVANTMAHKRLGCMCHYYGGMLDVYTDLTMQLATFGGHIEMLEPMNLLPCVKRFQTMKS